MARGFRSTKNIAGPSTLDQEAVTALIVRSWWLEDIGTRTAGLGERRPGAGIMDLLARSGHTLKICRAPIVGVQASNIPLLWWGSTIISCGSGDAIKCPLFKPGAVNGIKSPHAEKDRIDAPDKALHHFDGRAEQPFTDGLR